MTERDMTGPLLNRSAWLEAHGFAIDPFSAEAFQAETDPLFEHPGLPAFVDPPRYEEIRGRPDKPGFRYIFAPSGGGKTSLRKRIKFDFDASLALNLSSAPRVLAVEYVIHDYPPTEIDAHAHMMRVTRLIHDRLASLSLNANPQPESDGSAFETLENVITLCQDLGFDGICVLVDGIDSRHDEGVDASFQRIVSLAARSDLLTARNALFKFLLPSELHPSLRKKLPLAKFMPYSLEWDKDQLRTMLSQRLSTCTQNTVWVRNEERLSELFSLEGWDSGPFAYLAGKSPAGGYTRVEDWLVDMGHRLNQPRAMWQIGYCIFDEHFRTSRQSYARRFTDLIGRDALSGAYDRVENDFSPSLSYQYNPEELIALIKKCIEKDELEDALRHFCRIDEKLSLVLLSRYQRAKKRYGQGVIRHGEFDSEINTIILTVLDALQPSGLAATMEGI